MSHPQQPEDASITLLDILSRRFGPVQQTILGYLDASDEAHLRGVCKQLFTFSPGYRDWDHILGKFFSSPTKFRSFQAQCNGIVSGNVVLDFFARTKNFILSDPVLILSVPYDSSSDPESYLEREGYKPVAKDTETYKKYSRYHYRIWEVYEHPDRSTSGENRVKVLHVDSYHSGVASAFKDAALKFTACHNFVTWNKAYSLFPYVTFVEQKGYFTREVTRAAMESGMGHQLDQIAAAGYDIRDVAWYPEQTDRIVRRRRFGDKHSWIIDLPTNGVIASSLPDGAIASSTFYIKLYDNGSLQNLGGTYYTAQTCPNALISPVLRHIYMLRYEEGSKYRKQLDFLKQRLQASTVIELFKLDEADRPPRYPEIRDPRHLDFLLGDQDFLDSFTKPSSWTYKDKEVIEYLNRLEEEFLEGRTPTRRPRRW
jgi:hypothetical protein